MYIPKDVMIKILEERKNQMIDDNIEKWRKEDIKKKDLIKYNLRYLYNKIPLVNEIRPSDILAYEKLRGYNKMSKYEIYKQEMLVRNITELLVAINIVIIIIFLMYYISTLKIDKSIKILSITLLLVLPYIKQMIRTSLRVFIYFIRSIIYSIKVIYELIETVVFYTIYIITQMIERINKYIIIKIFIMLNIGYREDKIEKMYKLIKKIIPYENKRTFIFIFLKVYLCVMWILIICKIIYIMILNIFKN